MKQETIYGLHSVLACLEHSPENILKLMIDRNRDDQRVKEILDLAKQHQCAVEYMSKDNLTKFAGSDHHQGAIAVCRMAKYLDEHSIPDLLEALDHPAFVLILDNIQDPHNLGACLRSANAAKVDFVIMPKTKSAPITSTVRKVASGAVEATNIVQVVNLARTMEVLKEAGVWLYGLAGEAEQMIYECDFTGSIGLVLGSEGKGLRRLTRDQCDGLVAIPMMGEVESLNVSVATGISVFEVRRQRA